MHLTSRRKVAVVACMDSRLDVEKVLGLDLGDAHVIRNGSSQFLDVNFKADGFQAGGRAVEALRSILISQQMLGTREIIIMHHVRHPPLSVLLEKNLVSTIGPIFPPQPARLTPPTDRLRHADLLRHRLSRQNPERIARRCRPYGLFTFF